MVQQRTNISPELPDRGHKKKRWYLISILLIGSILYMGLPPFLEEAPDGGYILSKERQDDFDKKPLKSEKVEVYRLIANISGYYPCYNCNSGITQVYLNAGEVWKYGISRHGRGRYEELFYIANKVTYRLITVTDILNAEQLEIELIISYPLLPECQKRMKLHKIFLKRPPGNSKDK